MGPSGVLTRYLVAWYFRNPGTNSNSMVALAWFITGNPWRGMTQASGKECKFWDFFGRDHSKFWKIARLHWTSEPGTRRILLWFVYIYIGKICISIDVNTYEQPEVTSPLSDSTESFMFSVPSCSLKHLLLENNLPFTRMVGETSSRWIKGARKGTEPFVLMLVATQWYY